MSDGTFERSNKAPRRGTKLQHQGSNPTGTQTKSFKPEYSGDGDMAIGASSLNHNVRAKADDNSTASHKLRGETGLTFKVPLF